MSQPHMPMMNMGGPVGGQPMGAGTPGGTFSPDQVNKRLNTAIYEYLLCQREYDVARAFSKSSLAPDTSSHIKQSPSQRGHQANGMDMDTDKKEHEGVRERPGDLPAPSPLHNEDSSFLLDWWLQFWELYQGLRHGGRNYNTINYVHQQRTAQKARVMLNGMEPNMQPMRNYNNMMNSSNMDLQRQAAMKNVKMTPANLAQMRSMQSQANQMQGNQMERQTSQMDLSGPRSGSPHNGDAPSPKRQRTDGNMPQMNQGRPGQPGQMQGNQVGLPINTPLLAELHGMLLSKGFSENDIRNMSQDQLQKLWAQKNTNASNKSVEVYSQAIQQQMQAAMRETNANKGIPPNNAMVPAGAQSSPMGQPGMEAPNGEYYNNNNNPRVMQQQNGAVVAAAAAAAAAGQQNGQNNGNHALQDYQMQLMLLEQQNKKRLLMARQEQDSLSQPSGVPVPNGGGRGSPNPGMMDSNVNPALRSQMMMAAAASVNGGQAMMRPPSSHPVNPVVTPQMAEMLRQNGGQMMANGSWQGPQPPHNMMPGQQAPPGQPPNMTPRGGIMPPPPAPAGGTTGTQPSSPAQPAAPPTPNPANKSKPPAKKDNKANKVRPGADYSTRTPADSMSKAASKKGGAAAATNEDNAPPTPTPPPPVTPSAASSFGQNKNMAMSNGQQPNQGPNGTNPHMQPPPPDMGVTPFGALDGPDQFSNMDFADLGTGDVLETFDFDSFLNNDDQGLGAFDANFAFGDASIETDGIGN